jgi:hypothetical protein
MLKIHKKGRCRIYPATPTKGNFIPAAAAGIKGLEPHTSHKVNNPDTRSGAGNTAKARRVKLGRSKEETRPVQNVDERRLQFESDPLADREPFCNRHVEIEKGPGMQAIDWEVPECAGVQVILSNYL